MDEAAEFARLKELHEAAQLMREGGNPAVFLPAFGFQGDLQDQRMDLLLYPQNHAGYATRLFFERARRTGNNWGPHRVCNRDWFAPSRQGVRADQPWLAILMAHLRAVA